MDPSNSLQFLYHPGDSCEAKGLMARLSWRHLHPVRLRLLFKAQAICRHTVHACLQAVVCGALISSLSPPFAQRAQIDLQEHIIFLPQYHNIGKIQEMLPVLPWIRGERVACWFKIFYLHRKANSGVCAGRIEGKAVFYLYIYLRNWIGFIFYSDLALFLPCLSLSVVLCCMLTLQILAAKMTATVFFNMYCTVNGIRKPWGIIAIRQIKRYIYGKLPKYIFTVKNTLLSDKLYHKIGVILSCRGEKLEI